MIVFFSSCELVEFHYSLFLHTLSCRSGAPTSEQLPSASWPLKFLRLHGNMEQEVSPLFPTPHSMSLVAREPWCTCVLLGSPGPGKKQPKMEELLVDAGEGAYCSLGSCSGALFHLRELTARLACVYLSQLLRQLSSTK